MKYDSASFKKQISSDKTKQCNSGLSTYMNIAWILETCSEQCNHLALNYVKFMKDEYNLLEQSKIPKCNKIVANEIIGTTQGLSGLEPKYFFLGITDAAAYMSQYHFICKKLH